jgi:hypothetical protein
MGRSCEVSDSVGARESCWPKRGERRSIGETNLMQLSHGRAGAKHRRCFLSLRGSEVEDRRCDSEPEALNASKARVVVPALATLPQGVWQISRSAFRLHHDGRSIADE